MKKRKTFVVATILVLALVGALALSFAGCKQTDGDDTLVHIVMPDGAPAIAMAKLLHEKPQMDGYQITYEIVQGAAPVQAQFSNKTATLAIMPTNLAAIFYNNLGAKLLSVNTHGMLYLVGKEEKTAPTDLVGEVVYNIGRGGIPDITFRHILTELGIPFADGQTATPGQVSLAYVESGTELIPMLKLGTAKFGILGEPAVTQAVAKVGVSILFSIKDLWTQVTNTTSYPQSGLVVQKDFAADAKNQAFLAWLLGEVAKNDDWAKENPALVGTALKNGGSLLDVTFSSDLIARSAIKTVAANDAKESLNSYYEILFANNQQAIGGKKPADDFYFVPQA